MHESPVRLKFLIARFGLAQLFYENFCSSYFLKKGYTTIESMLGVGRVKEE